MEIYRQFVNLILVVCKTGAKYEWLRKDEILFHPINKIPKSTEECNEPKVYFKHAPTHYAFIQIEGKAIDKIILKRRKIRLRQKKEY